MAELKSMKALSLVIIGSVIFLAAGIFIGQYWGKGNDSQNPTADVADSVAYKPSVATAEPVSEVKKDVRGYRGSIGDNYKITMELHIDGSFISGSYAYDTKKIPIDLKGTIEPNGDFNMTETDDGKVVGYFSGRLDKQTISGDWKSADGKRSYSFYAQRDDAGLLSDGIAFTRRILERKYDLGDTGFTDSISVDLLFAENNAALNKRLKAFYYCTLTEYYDSQEEWINGTLKSAQSDIREMFGDEEDSYNEISYRQFYYQLSSRVLYEDNKYLSIMKYVYDEVPGGCGNRGSCNVYNWNKTTGKGMKFDELFKNEVAQVIYEGLMKKYGKDVLSISSPSELCDLDDCSIIFAFSADGIDFIFNPYHIACGAADICDVVIPYEELEKYMKIKL